MASLPLCKIVMITNVGDIGERKILLNSILDHLGNLKSLDCWRAKSLTDAGLIQLSQGCQKLQELDIGWCGNIRSGSGSIQRLIRGTGIHLRKLYLTANRTVNDQDLKALAESCPNLEQLDILGTGEVTAKLIERVLESCNKLIFFDISFCGAIDFGLLDGLRDQYPNVAIKKSFQT